MSLKLSIARSVLPDTRDLFGVYVRVGAFYFLLVSVFWVVGVEGIYGHPAPFYGLIYPAVGVEFLGWHLQALVVLGGAVFLSVWGIGRYRLLENEPDSRIQRRVIAWFVLLAFVVAGSVAMIRGGLDGISQAYGRGAYEYVGDIGVGGSLRGLFEGYERYHEFLSMHSKVHPPGPIAILWVMSFVLGRSALMLSLGTMALGATSVVPFYFWVRDMFGYRAAIQSTLLYVFVPTVVLFTATSADITFMPFTLMMLFSFWRSITRGSLQYALLGGVFYGLCSLISFSLIGVGIFFGLVGLWKLRMAETRLHVLVTAVGMLIGLLGVHYLVWLWSGFNVFRIFELSKMQFDTDQMNLDIYDPRYPSWVFRFLNPMCWFYFAGIPVSVLALKQLFGRGGEHRWIFGVIGITLVALDILYLARGEGERSAMYVMPFVVIPAGYYLSEVTRRCESLQPLTVTVLVLAFQCWLTETILYTYW